MNTWRMRSCAVLAFVAAQNAHALVTSSLPNSPEGMLIFHGSAAVVDALLMIGVGKYLYGALAEHMETLCLVSIAINFLGWILYLAYLPPIIFDLMAWGLCYVQWIRLLWVDRYDVDPLGFHLVYRPAVERA